MILFTGTWTAAGIKVMAQWRCANGPGMFKWGFKSEADDLVAAGNHGIKWETLLGSSTSNLVANFC